MTSFRVIPPEDRCFRRSSARAFNILARSVAFPERVGQFRIALRMRSMLSEWMVSIMTASFFRNRAGSIAAHMRLDSAPPPSAPEIIACRPAVARPTTRQRHRRAPCSAAPGGGFGGRRLAGSHRRASCGGRRSPWPGRGSTKQPHRVEKSQISSFTHPLVALLSFKTPFSMVWRQIPAFATI